MIICVKLRLINLGKSPQERGVNGVSKKLLQAQQI